MGDLWGKRDAGRFLLLVGSILMSMTLVVYATGVVAYTVGNGKLQNNTVNDVFIYSTWGETSNASLAFDANWIHGIAKTTGDPTVNPSSNITLSGTQVNKSQKIRIRIESGGATGSATFKTSIDGGNTWSTTTYITQGTAQNLVYDGIDTGVDAIFAPTASWTTGDIFTVESWWTEGANLYRSSTQDFPLRVAIFVTNSGVEIIDLSDNSVWMRFVSSYPQSDGSLQNVVADIVESVWALNGKIYLGSTATYQAGLTVIDFVQDKVWFMDNGSGWDYQGNIAMRNGGAMVGGWAAGSYEPLNSNQVNDVAAAVIGSHTIVLIGTSAGVNAYRDHTHVLDNTHQNCGANTNVPAVAIVNNAAYWALPNPGENGYLCAQYNPSNIAATGSWAPISPYQTFDTPPRDCIISTGINDIAVRPSASPLAPNKNIVYIATDDGLTIMHEALNDADADCRHYGHMGSGNANLTYKVLAGTTDRVTAVDYVYNHTDVYVGTNDNSQGGALSVLRPYIENSDTPFLIDYYRTSTAPSILSNNISAVDYGGTDALLATDQGGNRLTDAPTPISVHHVQAHLSIDIRVIVGGIVLALLGGVVMWGVKRYYVSALTEL